MTRWGAPLAMAIALALAGLGTALAQPQPTPGDPIPPAPPPAADPLQPAPAPLPVETPVPAPVPEPVPTAAPPAATYTTGTFDPNAGLTVQVVAPIRREGFFIEADLGLGTCSGELCSGDVDLGLDLGLQLAGLYRLSSLWALGAIFRYTSLASEVDGKDVDASAAYSMYGVASRFFFSSQGQWDPWAGPALGFVGFSFDVETDEVDLKATLDGKFLELAGGVDYRSGESLAFGLAVHYVVVFWDEACIQVGDADAVCVGDEGSELDDGDLPDLIGITAGVRYYF